MHLIFSLLGFLLLESKFKREGGVSIGAYEVTLLRDTIYRECLTTYLTK